VTEPDAVWQIRPGWSRAHLFRHPDDPTWAMTVCGRVMLQSRAADDDVPHCRYCEHPAEGDAANTVRATARLFGRGQR
jgi:hypothetical protein